MAAMAECTCFEIRCFSIWFRPLRQPPWCVVNSEIVMVPHALPISPFGDETTEDFGKCGKEEAEAR